MTCISLINRREDQIKKIIDEFNKQTYPQDRKFWLDIKKGHTYLIGQVYYGTTDEYNSRYETEKLEKAGHALVVTYSNTINRTINRTFSIYTLYKATRNPGLHMEWDRKNSPLIRKKTPDIPPRLFKKEMLKWHKEIASNKPRGFLDIWRDEGRRRKLHP